LPSFVNGNETGILIECCAGKMAMKVLKKVAEYNAFMKVKKGGGLKRNMKKLK